MSATDRIDADRLIDFAAAVYAATGVPAEDARLTAASLVQADLWGHQSHGVMRLSWYIARLRAGMMRPVTDPELVTDTGPLAVLDGHDGVGQVIAARAAQEAITRAKKYGVAAVAVRNSNHFGTAMFFTLMAPPAGCVAFLSTNASPAMAPWGGRKKTVGTNPWSLAAPAGRYAPMVLDIANTGVARGKVYLARQKGLSIPLGWAINAEGEPTTDPLEALEGIILPMAEHKGYAIATMMDVFSGVLSGSKFGADVAGPYQTERRSGCGHLMIAISIEAIQPLAEFNSSMERMVEQLRAVPLAKGFEEILYPGELEARNEARNRQDGLLLPQDTRLDLGNLAKEMALESKLPC
jgi:LDH2 family malate/lactate/ureidoglycolate dehydrogenase